MVNLEMTVKVARENALKDQSGEMKLIADSTNAAINADLSQVEQGRGKTNPWMMIILLSSVTAIIISVVSYRIWAKRKNK
jgi:hypothetical protein